MALHISRLPRNVGASYLHTRRLFRVLEGRPTRSNLAPLAGCSELSELRIDDLTIWSRGVGNSEVQLYRHSIRNNQAIIWNTYGNDMILLCESKKNTSSASNDNTGRPSQSQLEVVQEKLGTQLPNIFAKPMDYNMFHVNVIFENNIRGSRTVGLPAFLNQIGWLRITGHWKFVYVKMDVLKITNHVEDGTVRIRWRIRGVSMWAVCRSLWKYKIWNIKEALGNLDSWHDGFCTCYVGSDGIIYKVVVDKMMPDQEQTPITVKNPLAAKVALALGFMPRDVLDLSDMCWYSKKDSLGP